MKILSAKWLSVLAGVCSWVAAAGAAEFFIHDGDRVVFLGDSITEQRLYTTYIEAYTVTRHPQWKLFFRNVGWGGDTSWLRQRSHPDERQLFAAEGAALDSMVENAVKRGLTRDVLPLKPTVVTVKFGMNDHSYQAFRPDIFRAYVRSQEEIANVLKANGARVAFLTPQPIEEKRPDPDQDVKNISLRRFSEGLKDVANKTGSLFVDQFDPYMALMLKARQQDPNAIIGGGDAVHPGPAGHTLMAWAILKGLDAESLVSSAQIDAGSGKGTGSRCQVQNVKVSNGTVTFDRFDEALPMPIDPKAQAALKLAPVLQDLDRYELRVSGLPVGEYQVKVDGQTALTTTAEKLAAGINLANEAGPITAQAQQVLELIFKKNNVYFSRWRNVQLFDFPEWARGAEVEQKRQAELAKLDQEIGELESQIDSVRQPKLRHFEVSKSGPGF